MDIKRTVATALLAAAGCFALVGPALARGHVQFGVVIGGPGYWPGYYRPYYPYPYAYPYGYPYPYYPPVVAAPVAPPVYIEQGVQQAPPETGNWWYYCADAKAYYPYVRECAAGWQRVAPQPPQ